MFGMEEDPCQFHHCGMLGCLLDAVLFAQNCEATESQLISNNIRRQERAFVRSIQDNAFFSSIFSHLTLRLHLLDSACVVGMQIPAKAPFWSAL